MKPDLTPWHTLIAEAAHVVAERHGGRLRYVEGTFTRDPKRDAYRVMFVAPGVDPFWIDLDAEELACAEERDSLAIVDWLAAKLEPAFKAQLAAG